MQQLVADIRQELAEVGVEFTVADLDDILNLAASLAACLGGTLYFDCGEHWGLEVEIDEEDPMQQRCYVEVFYFDADEVAGSPEEEPN